MEENGMNPHQEHPKGQANITLRKALPTDSDRIIELVKELALFEKAPEEVTVSREHFWQSGFGDKPVWWAIVAEVGGRLEGFALWYVRFSTWKGQRLYLEDLYVTPHMRCHGIGRLLLDALMEEGKSQGFSGAMWQVLDWNEPAINFYKKYGAQLDGEWINCSVEFGAGAEKAEYGAVVV